MLSRTPAAATCELTRAMMGLWLLGLMTASEILCGAATRWVGRRPRRANGCGEACVVL